MTNVKNFGLIGVGSSVQFGKGGSRLKVIEGKILARNAADSALVNIQAAAPVATDDLVTLGHLNTLSGINIQDGMDLPLGAPTDGSLALGAVPLGVTDTVTDAIDGLNEVLAKLVPSQPLNFPGGQTLSLSTANTTTHFLASGVTDNTAGGTLPATAGQSVTRVTAATVTTTTINDTGPGDTGTITAYVNNTAAGAVTLASTIQTGNLDNGSLRVNDNKDFPTNTPGFWQSVDALIQNAAAAVGWNRLRIAHSAAGQTNEVYFVRDNNTASPAVAGGTVAEAALGTVAYSSSVPHYNTGASLTISGLTMTNLAGTTYLNGNPISVAGATGNIGTANYSYANVGVTTPIPVNTTAAQSLSALTFAIGGTVTGTDTVRVTGTNINGTGTQTIASPVILVKRGTNGVDEMLVPVNGLGSSPVATLAQRVKMVTGDTPTATFTGTASDWVVGDPLAAHDAAVVAAVLKYDQTNYSTGYLPVGPNLSGRDTAQYVTFWFRRTPVSKFDIKVAATGVAGCWVKLVGISDAYSSAGGWWSMQTPYGGAGTPGDIGSGNGSNGCALGGVMPTGSALATTTTYTATFGQVSSSAATNNAILVRFRLNAGQSISALSFEAATR